MQINSVQSNYQPNFQANVSDNFIKAAKNHLTKVGNQAKIDAFVKKIDNFKNYGSDDIDVIHERIFRDGKQYYALYATKKGLPKEDNVLLTVKDQFRKVVEKFMHINKYEFETKTQSLL